MLLSFPFPPSLYRISPGPRSDEWLGIVAPAAPGSGLAALGWLGGVSPLTSAGALEDGNLGRPRGHH